jgi:hypothetical protein
MGSARRAIFLGALAAATLACTVGCTGGLGLFDTGAERTGPGFGPGMGEDDVTDLPGVDAPDDRRGRGQKRGKRVPRGEPDRDEPGDEPGEPEAPPERRGIRYLGDDTWRVQGGRLDGWTENPGQLGANVVRKNRGYEVVGVRDGSDAEALGARNGDLLEEVNGYALNDQMDLIQLWAQVGSEDQFRVRLVRDGKPRVHRYLVAR